MSLGPEEIEEECRAEDESHEDTSEDIVRSGANIVVVVDISVWVETLNKPLLVDVVCARGSALAMRNKACACEWAPRAKAYLIILMCLVIPRRRRR